MTDTHQTGASEDQTRKDGGRLQAAAVLCILAGLIALIALAALISGPLTMRQTIGAVLILVFAVAAAFFAWWSRQSPTLDVMCDRYKACVAWTLALGGGALVAFVLVWVLWRFAGATETPVGLSLIVLVGVITLLIVISLVTFTYSVLGLASPKEALGLPDGSVRAIIALMLLVLFSLVSIYLYNNVAHLDPKLPGYQGALDLAKQLITLLGTLVTAVASFYFGANAVSSAHKDAAKKSGDSEDGPTVNSINPQSLSPGGQNQVLTLAGANLGKITALHLEQGAQRIAGAIGERDDSRLKATVNVPVNASGVWDLAVNGSKVNLHVQVP